MLGRCAEVVEQYERRITELEGAHRNALDAMRVRPLCDVMLCRKLLSQQNELTKNQQNAERMRTLEAAENDLQLTLQHERSRGEVNRATDRNWIAT